MMKAKGKILLGAEILSNSYLCKCKYPERTENNKVEHLVEKITPSDARMTNWSFSVSDQWKNSGTEMTP